METAQGLRVLRQYLQENSEGVREYQLLQFLQKEQPNFFGCLGEEPSLYKRHFFLFHQLYLLHDLLSHEGMGLKIEPLEINLVKSVAAVSGVANHQPLEAFYRDASNLNLSNDELEKMQRQFWEKFLALDKKAEALKVLQIDLSETLDSSSIKRQFNRLAQTHHPDKGGDVEEFVKIKNAYQQLKRLLN